MDSWQVKGDVRGREASERTRADVAKKRASMRSNDTRSIEPEKSKKKHGGNAFLASFFIFFVLAWDVEGEREASLDGKAGGKDK